MSDPEEHPNRRILIVDDQESIHDDFRKILGDSDEGADASLQDARSAFFGAATEEKQSRGFELTFARQGDEGIGRLKDAVETGVPFAMAFVDVRMPPGPDGLQTIKGLWTWDDDLQVVICTAYSDYSFEEIVAELGYSDRLLILKKPFDPVEVRQLAGALTEKWNSRKRERAQFAELEEANRKAEAASQAKSEFLANMSHEIRTPMNALLGYIDLICDPSALPSERDHYGETIRRSGEHLLTILNDILDISRIEAGRMVLSRTEFSPVELGNEVVALMLTSACEKDLELSFETHGKLPLAVVSDPVRVRQILLNLVGNAVKFTKRGSVRLVLRAEEVPGGCTLEFDVVDTGIGISQEQRVQLFQPFSQADTSSTRTAGGTGLGLAISSRLARMLGGSVSVRSEEGRGSTFTLAVGPLAVDGAPWVEQAPRPRMPAPPTAPDDPDGQRLEKRVLLVEDVKLNQVLISAILRKAGATVTVAENGDVGCEAVEEAVAAGAPFDLVLMDMQMPVMDGYEATRELRTRGHALPIVALTAHAMAGDREKCLEAGCTEYATKPLDRKVLLALCRRVLEPRAPLPRRASDVSPETSPDTSA